MEGWMSLRSHRGQKPLSSSGTVQERTKYLADKARSEDSLSEVNTNEFAPDWPKGEVQKGKKIKLLEGVVDMM